MLLAALGVFQQPQAAAPRQAVWVEVAGDVVRATGKDSVPVPQARVVLHRVGSKVQGPIDSVLADRQGHYQLRFRPDTGALYLVSARFRGIEYFAAPLSRDPAHPNLAVRLIVYDTSSSTPLQLAARHLVVGAPGQEGVRRVADLVLLENPGNLTRLAGDSLHPTWRMLLPRAAEGIELGESDFAADAVVQHADTLFLNASVPPGQREFTLTYRIPIAAAQFEIPVDHAAVAADLLAEETGLTVEGGLTRGDSVSVVERSFTRWSGSLTAGTPLVLHFPGVTRVPDWMLPVLIGGLGLALLVMGVAASRRTRPPLARAGVHHGSSAAPGIPHEGVGPEARAVIEQIAQLDAAHAGDEAAADPAGWQGYLRERGELKARLTALLRH